MGSTPDDISCDLKTEKSIDSGNGTVETNTQPLVTAEILEKQVDKLVENFNKLSETLSRPKFEEPISNEKSKSKRSMQEEKTISKSAKSEEKINLKSTPPTSMLEENVIPNPKDDKPIPEEKYKSKSKKSLPEEMSLLKSKNLLKVEKTIPEAKNTKSMPDERSPATPDEKIESKSIKSMPEEAPIRKFEKEIREEKSIKDEKIKSHTVDKREMTVKVFGMHCD